MNEDEIERKVVYMKHPSFYDSFSPDDYAHRSLTERKQKKKILKKRDELEGMYIQLSTQGVYIHSATSFASIIISHCGSLMKSDQSVIFVMYGIASFLFLVDLMCFLFSHFSFRIVEQSLTYLCILGGLYSRPTVRPLIIKQKQNM